MVGGKLRAAWLAVSCRFFLCVCCRLVPGRGGGGGFGAAQHCGVGGAGRGCCWSFGLSAPLARLVLAAFWPVSALDREHLTLNVIQTLS